LSLVLEQSVATCHVRTFYVCFPKSPQGFSLHCLQAFIPMTFTATFVVQVPAQCAVILSFSDTLIVLFTYFLLTNALAGEIRRVQTVGAI